MKINLNATINNAFNLMNKYGSGCLVVIDFKTKKVLGTLSDGDIRKKLLFGTKLSDKINNIYNKNPITFNHKNYNLDLIKKTFIKKKIDLIPILNQNNTLRKIYRISEFVGKKHKEQATYSKTPILIMAGGKGKRLGPITHVLPKPLVPVKSKTMIELVLDQFLRYGYKNLHISINYKASLIKAFFKELKPSYKIKFIEEKKPLGTAHSLHNFKNSNSKIVVMTNCDIIIKEDINRIIKYHIENFYDLTLVGTHKEFFLPYGACEINKDGTLKLINEKPTQNYLINAGLYVINTKKLKNIKKNIEFNITDLTNNLLNENKKVGIYVVEADKWIDFGQISEYQKSIERV